MHTLVELLNSLSRCRIFPTLWGVLFCSFPVNLHFHSSRGNHCPVFFSTILTLPALSCWLFHILCILLFKASVTQHNVFEIHPYFCRYHWFIPFYSLVVIPSMNVSEFIQSFFCGLPVWGWVSSFGLLLITALNILIQVLLWEYIFIHRVNSGWQILRSTIVGLQR